MEAEEVQRSGWEAIMRGLKYFFLVMGIFPCLLFAQSTVAATWFVDASILLPGDGKSWQAAFRRIQEGIDAASDGDTVIVADGTYFENVNSNGKNIVLTCADPLDATVVAATVIDGNRNGPAVAFAGTEDETCVLSGFTIMNGSPGILGGPWGHPGGRATIRNNVVKNNYEEDGGGLCRCDGVIRNNTITSNHAGICGAGLYDCDGIIMNNRIIGNESSEDGGGLGECDGIIQNNLIAGNTAWESGQGLYECHGVILNCTIVGNSSGYGGGLSNCHGLIMDCIIWGNSREGSGDQLYGSNTPAFGCIQNWSGGGKGNISEDPLFVNAEAGDYRLKIGSPCVNAGANFYWFAWPQRDPDGNCRLFGDRVDMGCYEYGSSPDSDGDLLSDAAETSLVPLASNPNDDDSDGDGLRDGLEILRGSDPMSPTPPRVVNVPSDASTVQQALCLAVQGDTINLEPGTYTENIHFCGTDVVLRNFQYGNPNWWWWLRDVVLDGGGAGPAVSFEGSESPACVLAGFTIRNGKAHTGGGIRGGRRGRHTRATICDNELTSNSAAGWGGGIALCDGIIRGNMITANSGEGGGGLAFCHGLIESNRVCANSAERVYGDGGGFYDCDGTVRENVISENSADTGGGLYQCDGTIRSNAIAGNVAKYGGALNECHATIESNTISANEARDGGGIFGSNGVIRDNIIMGNTAEYGGGLSWCHGTIQNNIIRGNRGGGLALCHGIVQSNLITGNLADGWAAGLTGCGGLILNNSIVNNSSSEKGGGLDDCCGTIVNCIIWGNAGEGGEQIYDSNPPSYCCIQDWRGGGIGNLTEDPLFAAPASGDYHLQPGSPCIDAGANYHWISWPQRDLDGNCRLVGERVDIGCYEYGASRDSDGDLLSDADESARGTDAAWSDTDGDGLRDGLEILRGSDPVAATPCGVLRVPSDVATVQGGLCLTRDCDEIVVAPGTYQENIYFCGFDVIVRSTDPLNPSVVASTVLDGSGAGPVVTFTGYESEACVLSGFTIRNGHAEIGADIGTGVCGGTEESHTHATIKNNVITENSSDYGAAVEFCDGVLENNTISKNACKGLASCNGTVRNNIISENSGSGLSGCKGIIEGNMVSENTGEGFYECSAVIRGNTISGNHERGLFLCKGTIIENNVICGNLAYDGAGMYGCSNLIQNNLIIGNHAGRCGGAIFSSWGTVRNNIIVGNTAGGSGGGLCDCYAVLVNNTIVANRAGAAGGGARYSHLTTRNCIFWGNTAPQDPQLSACVPTHCCVQHWSGGGVGNISADPLFVDPDGPDDNPDTYEDNDYRLRADSPCIDAGDNSGLDPDEGDIKGMHRIMFGGKSLTVDMGAYEFYINRLEPIPGMAVLTWSSLEANTYSIFYTDDLFTWHLAIEDFPSFGNTTTSWLDDGTLTGLPPSLAAKRFYRILENP
jgi:hypothetical protein